MYSILHYIQVDTVKSEVHYGPGAALMVYSVQHSQKLLSFTKFPTLTSSPEVL